MTANPFSLDWDEEVLGMPDPTDDVGMSWGDFGEGAKWGFQNVVHPLGKGIASAAGAGSAASSLENLEQQGGLLPKPQGAPSAKSAHPSSGAAATAAAPATVPSASSAQTQSQQPALSWFHRHPFATTGIGVGIVGFFALVIGVISSALKRRSF